LTPKYSLVKFKRKFQMNKNNESEGDGDSCPFCNYFNEPLALDTCEHFYGFVWDGQFDTSEKLTNLQNLWKDSIEYVEGNNTHKSLISNKSLNGFKEKITRYTNSDSLFTDLLTNALDAKSGDGWSTDGMLSGSGYNVYLSEAQIIDKAESFLKDLLNQKLVGKFNE
jgi:hypothetical protein